MLVEWFKKFKESSYYTQMFLITFFIWMLISVITTIYCYGRLDFARSYPSKIPNKSPDSISKKIFPAQKEEM